MLEMDAVEVDVQDSEGTQETKATKLTQEERVVEDFKQTYKKLFGVFPFIHQTNGYYRVRGYPDGMSIKRLKSLTCNYRSRIKATEST